MVLLLVALPADIVRAKTGGLGVWRSLGSLTKDAKSSDLLREGEGEGEDVNRDRVVAAAAEAEATRGDEDKDENEGWSRRRLAVSYPLPSDCIPSCV